MSDYNILFLQWKKIQKDFEKNLSLLLLRINTEPVHDIRVATKKPTHCSILTAAAL